ncbi:MAG: phosphodiester glycosidase family protein [Anaerolineales bacterium]|nr:phosphodiester glycosidase family protein [Anaerolineales bacterium]MCW5854762.1 phosphodiester glycosidase family protein [Anaerolineales bacterium]
MLHNLMTKPTARFAAFGLFVLLVGLACDLSAINPMGVRLSQPEPEKRQLFKGIQYERIVRQSPRRLVIHIVTIDLKADGLKSLVSPGNPDRDQPSSAKTTSAFLSEAGLQLAINGDAFTPWYDLGPFGFAPKPGQRVTPLGFAASRGVIYSQDTDEQPTLYLQPNNKVTINALEGKINNAISGYKLLVWNGELADGLRSSGTEPRTAVGLNKGGNKLVIIIVDGRQAGYSEGVTELELAQLMLERNVHSAINMDGGGSTTLVIEGENGEPLILNSPVHQGIPGNERPVANHLGFSARR